MFQSYIGISLAVGFLRWPCQIEEVPFFPSLLNIFIMKGVEFCQMFNLYLLRLSCSLRPLFYQYGALHNLIWGHQTSLALLE